VIREVKFEYWKSFKCALNSLIHLYFRAEVVVLGVVPSTIVALKRRVADKVLGDFVKASTLHTAHGCVWDKKLVLVFIYEVSVNLAGEFCMFGGGRQLTA